MPELTSEKLAEFFRDTAAPALRIEGFVDTDDSRYLGGVGLSRTQPLFHGILGFNWSGGLSDSARFYLVPISKTVEGQDGQAIVFRQFDSSTYQATPEDLLCGWVPPDDAERARGWVAEMNAQLQHLLTLKPR